MAHEDAERNIIAPAVVDAEIIFGYSTSPSYARALELCRQLPGFKSNGEGADTEHRLVIPVTEIELITNLWDLVSGWKSATMRIDSARAKKRDLVFGCLGCYRKRQQSSDPDQYCFADEWVEYPAGCRHLGFSRVQGRYLWLDSFGVFGGDGKWTLDRGKIHDTLLTGIRKNRLCPVLRPNIAFQFIDDIPELAGAELGPPWTERRHNRTAQPAPHTSAEHGASPAPTPAMRLEITPATIWRLITKTVFKKGLLEFRLEQDVSSGQWFVTGSGWKPLNDFKSDNPATLLRAIAMVMDHRPGVEPEHKSSESPTDEGRLLK